MFYRRILIIVLLVLFSVRASQASTEDDMFSAVVSGDVEKLNFLLENGEINIKNSDGESLLHVAIKHNQKDVLVTLIDKGAYIDVVDKNFYTPLFLAVDKNNKEMADILLNRGAEVNVQDRDKITPLHKAVFNNNIDIAVLLIDKGADMNICGAKNEITPFELTFFYPDMLDMFKLFIEKGADVNWKRPSGIGVLHSAADHGYKQAVEILIANGADINARASTVISGGEAGGEEILITPLLLAIANKHKDVVELLIEKGANINAVLKNDASPLIAALKADLKIAELLIEKGTNINVTDKQGMPTLYAVISQGYYKLAEKMIDKGADVNIGYKETTPLALLISKIFNKFTLLMGLSRMEDPMMEDSMDEKKYFMKWRQFLEGEIEITDITENNEYVFEFTVVDIKVDIGDFDFDASSRVDRAALRYRTEVGDIADIIGKSFKMTYTASGELVEWDGRDWWKVIKNYGYGNEEFVGQIENLIEQVIEGLLIGPPDKAVAGGDCWEGDKLTNYVTGIGSFILEPVYFVKGTVKNEGVQCLLLEQKNKASFETDQDSKLVTRMKNCDSSGWLLWSVKNHMPYKTAMSSKITMEVEENGRPLVQTISMEATSQCYKQRDKKK